MSWLLKQAEDILNRVDQQTNAALRQNNTEMSLRENHNEVIPESPSFAPLVPIAQPVINPISTNRTTITPTRRLKKKDDNDLINYLNNSTSINNNDIKQPIGRQSSNNKKRTNSSSLIANDESLSVISSHNNNKELILNIPARDETSNTTSEKQFIKKLQTEIETLSYEKTQCENELQIYRRQQIQYQHQIAESDALLRDLRARESDSAAVLSAKDSQIALLRVRLNEADELLQRKTTQYDELQNQYSHLLEDSSHIQSASFDSLKSRKKQLEHELERGSNENERLTTEKDQLIDQIKSMEKRLNDEHLQLYEQQQQTKHAKTLANQMECDLNEYKAKAQRILQAKDKLIHKLKEIVQQRSSTPTAGDQNELENIGAHADSTLLDISLVSNPSGASSNWASIQHEELKSENELFKQELQARELTIHTLRNELQEAELVIQQSEEQYQEKLKQLNEQIKDEHSRLTLVEQDYIKLKYELTSVNEDFHKQKQIYQGQLSEREREIERLRLQLTSKTINNVNYDELEKRLQTLTESVIHKQTMIETLQTDKSSLKMQLERLEKRLDDYETIAEKNSLQQSSRSIPTTSISVDDNEHYENLRYRMPLLRETPYDVDLTKKVKRAANELDRFGIRLTLLLRRYPAVRLGFLFYALILHLWTFIVLFTYTPEMHSNGNSMHIKDKL